MFCLLCGILPHLISETDLNVTEIIIRDFEASTFSSDLLGSVKKTAQLSQMKSLVLFLIKQKNQAKEEEQQEQQQQYRKN